MRKGRNRSPWRTGRPAPQGKISNLKLSRLFGARRDERAETDEKAAAEPERAPAGGGLRSPVVVGLGNPGRSYERTRHNVGFLVADELARRYGGSWRKKKKAEAAEAGIALRNVTLLKPTTFMNNSGSALAGYDRERLVVVHDDLDLPEGDVRIKVGGGAGGHNGLRSIIQHLGGDNNFVRVRIGIGRPPIGVTVTDYVLGRMNSVVREAVPVATDAVEALIESGPEAAMNRFNARP